MEFKPYRGDEVELDIQGLIDSEADEQGVPRALARALFKQESSYNPNAVNAETGATGLGQLMPVNSGDIDPRDPRANAKRSLEILKAGLAAGGGNVREALHYYYGGPNKKQWGARTRAYPDQVLRHMPPEERAQVVAIAAELGVTPAEAAEAIELDAAPAITPPLEEGGAAQADAELQEPPAIAESPEGEEGHVFQPYTEPEGEHEFLPYKEPDTLQSLGVAPTFDPTMNAADAIALREVAKRNPDVAGPPRPGPTVEAAARMTAERAAANEPRGRELAADMNQRMTTAMAAGDEPPLGVSQLASGVGQMHQSAVGTLAAQRARMLEVFNRIDAGESVPIQYDTMGYRTATPEQRQAMRAQIMSKVSEGAGKVAEIGRTMAEIPRNKNADVMAEQLDAGDWSSAWRTFASDPMGITQQFSLESLPMSAPAMVAGVAGAAVGRVPGLLLGVAAGNFPIEYVAAFGEALQEFKVDLSNAQQVEAALQEPQVLERIAQLGTARGLTIATVEAATARMLSPLTRQAGAMGNLARAGKNVAIETTTEPLGEATAQVVAGQELKPSEIAAEALGAGPQAVASTIARTAAEGRELSAPERTLSNWLDSAKAAPVDERRALQEQDYSRRSVDQVATQREAVDRAIELTEETGQQHRARLVGGAWVVVNAEAEPPAEKQAEAPPIAPEMRRESDEGAALDALEKQAKIDEGGARRAAAEEQAAAEDEILRSRVVGEVPDRKHALEAAAELTRQTGEKHEPDQIDGKWVVLAPAGQKLEPSNARAVEDPPAAAPAATAAPEAAAAPAPEAKAPEAAAKPPEVEEEHDFQPFNGVDDAAHAAATSPKNDKAVTPAQQLGGNAELGHPKVAGMELSIENPEGSTRRDLKNDPPKWQTVMKDHYGYIKGTVGYDKDRLDVFVKPGTPEDYDGPVFVVNQYGPGEDGKFDEHKVIIGAADREEAQEIYDRNYAKDWDGGGEVVDMPMGLFKKWAFDKEHGPKAGKLEHGYTAELARAVRYAPQDVKGNPPNDRGGYTPTEDLRMPNPRKGWAGYPAEIHLVELKDGRWIYTTGLNMPKGGHGSLPSVYEKPFPSREAALADAVKYLKQSVEGQIRHDPTNVAKKLGEQINQWLDGLAGAPPKAPKKAAKPAPEAPKPAEAPAGPMSDDDLSALFDEAAASVAHVKREKEEKAPPAPKAPGREPSVRKMAAEAAKLGVEGMDEALKGLTELFGGAGTVRSFPGGFDEETYAKAKPHFETALDRFQKAGKTLKDLFVFLVEQFGEGIKAYAIQFAKDKGLGTQLATPEAKAEPATEKPTKVAASVAVASQVAERLKMRQPLTWQGLFMLADKAFGGTQADGTYTVKDAYDALELGVNVYLGDMKPTSLNEGPNSARMAIQHLSNMLEGVPTQTKRTAEQDEFQQFSTPPAYAFVVNWVAKLTDKDVVLEPSAGLGGIAIFADNAGAKVVLNELSPRRAALLKALFPTAKVYTEDAAQIDNILPDDVKPTVVVMNPPFSATAGRVEGKRDTMEGAKHIEQALKRLAPGGRLVAIVGEGMAADRPAFKAWWAEISKAYNVKANIGIDGKGYAKYGTTFDNQILVIDKDGPTTGTVITGKVASVADLPGMLEGVRNGRPTASRSEQPSAQRDGGKPAATGVARPDDAARPGADAVAAPDARAGAGKPPAAGGAGGKDQRARPGRPERGDGVPADQRQRGSDAAGAPAGPGSRGDDAAAGAGGQDDRPGAVKVSSADVRQEGELTDSIFEQYTPQRVKIEGSKPHPGALVQSSAMGAVMPPDPTYTPNLPKEVIEKGLLSDAQLETVVYAGQAHSLFLPNGERRGFLVGDGTGVGKGREIAGILLDNIRQGRKKAVWLSEKQGLMNDAKRDFSGVTGDPSIIFNQNKSKPADKIAQKDGIMFSTYSTLRADEKRKPTDTDKRPARSRTDQIVEWLGEDFDGVIVFDEAHNMGNALAMKGKRGTTKPSAQALAGVDLQKRLPKARIVYVSATAATEVSNLTYASRLGLWGERTAFSSLQDFVSKVASAGVAAMELVARDMKALGAYIARSLSYDGVGYKRLTHELTPQQIAAYDRMADAWQVVLKNIHAAMKETKAAKNGNAKSAAMSQFWGAHLRFFSQLITAMQMPSVIEAAQKDIADGKSVLFQLVNTNEAGQEAAAAERQRKKDEGENVEDDDLEFGPMDGLIDYVRNSFPVAQYQEVQDDNGNVRSEAVLDSEKKPVINKAAVAMREALISDLQEIAKSNAIPGNPLDLIIEAFGQKVVGEITGRKRRFVRVKDGDGYKIVEEKRGKAAIDADAIAFMDGDKRVLIFSEAGGTGFSFHADNTKKNRQLRSHYLIQPGWRADKVMQGFGRSHRTNQAQPPEYTLVTTDLKAQKRFISSIARRLDQLGALTKGERKTASQGLFTAADNLESKYAHDALSLFFTDLYAGRIENLDFQEVESQMGLQLEDKKNGGLKKPLPEITQFLNRLLSLKVDLQGEVFDAFASRIEDLVQRAIDDGTFDDGLQTLRAQKIEKASEEVVHKDEETGVETKYVDLILTHPTTFNSWEQMNKRAEASGKDFAGFFRDNKTGKVFMVVKRGKRVNAQGHEYTKGERWEVSGDRRLIDNVDNIERDQRSQQQVVKRVPARIYGGDSFIVPYMEGSHHRAVSASYLRYLFDEKGPDAVRSQMIASANSPEEAAAMEEVLRRLEAGAVDGEREVRVPHYERLEKAEAERLWGEQTKAAPATWTDHRHLISGAILPIWDRFPDGPTTVARAQTVDGERFLGRVVPPADLKDTLRNLGVNPAKGLAPAEILRRVREGQVATLANGWTIKRSRVSNENRVEVFSPRSFTSGDERVLQQQGLLLERISWNNRFFIPNEEVLARVLASKPVVDLDDPSAPRASRRDEPPAPGRLTSAAAREVASSVGVDAEVVTRPELLPARLYNYLKSRGEESVARGIYDPQTGTVFLISNNIATREEAAFAAMHESAHRGLGRIFGAELDLRLRAIYDANPNVRARARAMRERYDLSIERATEEVLADMARAGNAKNLSGWQRLVGFIRDWLATRGLGGWSDAQIEALVGAAAKAGKTDGPQAVTENVEPRASRPTETIAGRVAQLHGGRRKLTEAIADHWHSDRTFNWWGHRGLGTQFHKAHVDTDFRRVFDLGQDYLSEFSRAALEAADLAPSLLPKIEGFTDIGRTLTGGASAADREAVGRAVLEGTLAGDGADPFKGKVWTDEELRQNGLTAKQIELYHQARAAIDKSLDLLHASEVVNFARKEITPELVALVRADPGRAGEIVADYLADRAEKLPRKDAQERRRLLGLATTLVEKQQINNDLKEHGYAPLQRFGDYTVTAKDETGKVVYFSMHEKQAEANAVRRQLASEHNDLEIETGIRSEGAYKLFKGLSPDTLDLFAHTLGVGQDSVFQEYLKVAKNTRSAYKRLIHRKGVSGFQTDLTRGLAQFITSNARAAASNWHMGDMRRAVDQIPDRKGDVKDEARDLMEYLQEPKEEAAFFRSLLFLNYLGGSLAAGLVNMTQPLTMTGPYLGQWGNARAGAEIGRAMKDALQDHKGELGAALQRGIEEGVVAPHEIHQLHAEAMRNLGGNLAWRRFTAFWGSFFAATELFNRRVTFIAAYRTAKRIGAADPYHFARRAVEETQGIYNRGNRPNWARGPIGAPVMTFKQFSIAYIEFLLRLPPRQRMVALAALVFFSGLQGLPFAEDLEDLVDTIAQKLGYSFNSRQQLRQRLARALGQTGADVLMRGVSWFPGMPLDVQGRLGMGNLLPGTSILKEGANTTREVLEVFGAAGAFGKSIGEAAQAALRGDLVGAAGAMAPKAIADVAKAKEMASKGMYTDTSGNKTIDTSKTDAAMKAIGFQPQRVAQESKAVAEDTQNKAQHRAVESRIAAKMAQGRFELSIATNAVQRKEAQEKITDARDELKDWNRKNPRLVIVITDQQITSRVRNMRTERLERIIKRAPPELRQTTREDLGRK